MSIAVARSAAVSSYAVSRTQLASANARIETQAPRSTKMSAAAACRVSSRVMIRTRTLVSMARITLPHTPPDALFHFFYGPSCRRLLREQRSVNVLGSEPARTPHHHLFAVFLPLQNRARSNAEFFPNLRRNRDLPLRGHFGMSECHALYYHGNGNSLYCSAARLGADSVVTMGFGTGGPFNGFRRPPSLKLHTRSPRACTYPSRLPPAAIV